MHSDAHHDMDHDIFVCIMMYITICHVFQLTESTNQRRFAGVEFLMGQFQFIFKFCFKSYRSVLEPGIWFEMKEFFKKISKIEAKKNEEFEINRN
jgi:hypothetical protein